MKFGPEYDTEKAFAIAWSLAGLVTLSAGAAMEASGVDGALYFACCIRMAALMCLATGAYGVYKIAHRDG